MTVRKRETRWYTWGLHSGGPITLLAEADGYVMARRPYAMPFVMPRKDWDRLPLTEPGVTR